MDKVIRLEPYEALLIAERVPNDAQDFESGEPLGRNYLLKIFSAIGEMTTDDSVNTEGFVEVSVNEKEMWLTRSYISLFDKVEGKLNQPEKIVFRHLPGCLDESFQTDRARFIGRQRQSIRADAVEADRALASHLLQKGKRAPNPAVEFHLG